MTCSIYYYIYTTIYIGDWSLATGPFSYQVREEVDSFTKNSVSMSGRIVSPVGYLKGVHCLKQN